MHIVTALSAGVKGTENGTASLFVRGGLTQARMFADFEGSVTLSNPLQLDSNGGTVVYVDSLVDVVAKSSTGSEVRRWVEAVSSPNVEVISQSFTGTDYTNRSGTTLSGVNKPTTLQAVLDLFLTELGGVDLKWLDEDGTTQLGIRNTLIALYGMMRSVKDPLYGAVGDGSADDEAAINACLSDGDGVVFFPPGTYRILDSLVVPSGVSIVGSGAGVSIISTETGGSSGMQIQGTSGDRNTIRGLTLEHGITATNSLIQILGSADVTIRDCAIGNTTTATITTGLVTSVFAGRSKCYNTVFAKTQGPCWTHRSSDATGELLLQDCKFSGFTTSTTDVVFGSNMAIRGCSFDMSGISTGEITCVDCVAVADGDVSVSDCVFTATTGLGVATGAFLSAGTSESQLLENGNTFNGLHRHYDIPNIPIDQNVQVLSRVSQIVSITDNSTTLDLDGTLFPSPRDFDTYRIRRTDGTNLTLQADGAIAGHLLYLTVYADSFSTVLVTLDSGFVTDTTYTVVAGGMVTFVFEGVFFDTVGTPRWALVGTPNVDVV